MAYWPSPLELRSMVTPLMRWMTLATVMSGLSSMAFALMTLTTFSAFFSISLAPASVRPGFSAVTVTSCSSMTLLVKGISMLSSFVLTVISNGWYPTYEHSNVQLLPTLMLKLPSSPLTTACEGSSLTQTLAPMISSPVFASLILPLITFPLTGAAISPIISGNHTLFISVIIFAAKMFFLHNRFQGKSPFCKPVAFYAEIN